VRRCRDGSDVWMSINISLARDRQFRTPTSSCKPRVVRRAPAPRPSSSQRLSTATRFQPRTSTEQLNRAIARVQRHFDQRFAVMYPFDRFRS
jgi:hypothetical protein